MQEKMQNDEEKIGKMKIYIALVAITILIALLSFLIVPRGTPLQRCMGIIILQNRYSCITSLALNSNNSSLCAYLPSTEEATCYYELATESNSSALCYKTYNTSAALGDACFEEIANKTGNYSFCEPLSGSYRDNCISNVAIKNENATLCGMLYNSTSSTICESAIYLYRAQETLNGAFCANVTDSTNSSVVGSVLLNDKYAPLNNATFAALEDYTSIGTFGVSARDICNAFVAIGTRNASECGSISSSTVRTFCNSAVAKVKPSNRTTIISLNATICAKLGMSSEQCSLLSALTNDIIAKNVSACSTLPESASYECYVVFAVQYKNTSYCGFIKNATANSACIEDVSFNITG
ncbi:MAG: hypothetical protein QXZ38_01380 [Candidatus Micrarchaeaceae archaeon]